MSPVLNSVSSDLVPANTSKVAWLGARHEAGWGWSDGTAWHYHNWGEGQPGAGKDCVVMYEDGTWSSKSCNNQRKFYWCKIH